MEGIKAVITDIDGVWTDSRIYLDKDGKNIKAFNTSDSVGVALLRLMEIPVIIVTGEDFDVIQLRARQLKIDHIFTGVRNKLFVAERALKEMGFSLKQAAFIGDDLNDLPLLKAVGLSAVPANAPELIKSQVNHVLNRSGGDGAFREFCELVLKNQGLFNESIDRYLKKILAATY